MCQPIRYRLHRVPAFRKGRVVRTNITTYTDRDMEKGMSYSYWLEAVADRKISQASPTLHYTFGQPFCGNGQIDRELGELCDDGNLRGGDGCDPKCKTEELFKCKGEPSLCYVFYGDGLCEDFEKESNVIDCGYHTPKGFVDQWAHEAEANPAFQLPECPARAAVGQPAPEDNCLSVRDPRRAWYPCGHSNQPEIYWLEVYIPRPVIVTEVILHLGSDGRNQTDMAPKNMSVDLILTDGTSFRLTPRDITLECKPDGFSFPVKHDLSTPFFKSKGVRLQFTSFNISIAGVRLRSSKSLDPITLTSCGEGHLYSPRSAVCVPAQCTNLTCGHYSAPHAHVKCTGFTDGHVCSLVCHDGYSFMWPSAMEVTCVRGQWMTSQDNICVPVPCGRLSLAYAKVTCNTSQPVFGDICTFRCRHPAKLQGVDNKVRCESDGLWSSPDSKCVVRCDPPLRMPGARLLTRSCRKGQQLVDTQCRIRCRKGYRVEGASAKRRRLSAVTCSSSSRWSGRGCVAVTCPHLDPIYKGLVTCSKGRQVYSTCRLRCPGETRTQSVTCKPSGKWSSRLTPCTSFRSTRCPKLKSRVVEASLTVRCRGYVVGTKCPCHCPTPDEEAVIFKKKANVRSMSTDTSGASRDVVINHVTCTGAGHWFPNPVDLKCVQSCNRNTVSDGWCDARNNRRRCQYDGGDCCQSTLGGPVQAPNSCVNACSCKDPRAKENRGKIRDVTGGGSARSVDEGEGWGYGRQ
ncbi:pappalysin-1-like [Aplysia californica]|uniref:Pappalysin-1-like n=1 Tax=Aplysia californica TaxID=6500 RepID=A0ABM0ZUZ0_APLCA|nr:pappalysin-1-like [Aplysia californica]